MVAIVTGNGLGLQASSALGLGGRGQVGAAGFGKAGEQVFVNAATGNLVLRDRDQWLMGRGVDAELYRAYNSQAQLVGESWRAGVSKQVGGLAGTVNTAGSTVYRSDWDGSRIAYVWDAARSLYVAAAGAGTRDTLAWDAGNQRWTWTQGGGQLIERYDAGHGGRLFESVDRDGNAVAYVYNAAGALAEVRTANGESTYLDYDGNGRLAKLRSVVQTDYGPRTSAAVIYGYDSAGRLATVSVDQSPDDSSVADGKAFVTTYGYDGSSGRIASIAQSDGARVGFGYQLIDGQHRVVSIAQTSDIGVLRTTTLGYDTANRRTTITDPLGQDTILDYDAQGRLLQTRGPAVNGARATQSFSYDAAGQVATIRDGLGNEVQYRYDAAGNLIRQQDAAGTVVERSYGSDGQLLSETVSGPNTTAATTRYIYDSEQHLRFKISAEGRVTELRYNAAGQQVAMLGYAEAVYTGSGYSETALAAWAASARIGERTDSEYDFRGNLSVLNKYGTLAADGSGVVDAKIQRTQYVYDPQGRLLQRFVGPIDDMRGEHFNYDALGRIIVATAFNETFSVTDYDDAQRQVRVSFDNGLVRTSSYNHAGELIAVSESGQSGPVLSQVRYHYDAAGRLRMSEDALGAKTHVLYDEAGRRVGEIDATGALVEYRYDANNQVVETLRYAQAVGAAALAALVDGNGKPVQTKTVNGAVVALTLANAGVRPLPYPGQDRVQRNYYDAAGRLSRSLLGDGELTTYGYDASSRLIRKTVHSRRVDMAAFQANPQQAVDAVGNDPSAYPSDLTTRYFYDRDGLLRASVVKNGLMTEYRYDAAGRRIQSIESERPMTNETGNEPLEDLLPWPNGVNRYRNYAYDTRGLLTQEIDGEGFITRYAYDATGRIAERIRGEQVSLNPYEHRFQASGSFKARTDATANFPVVKVYLGNTLVATILVDSSVDKTYSFSAEVTPGGSNLVRLHYETRDGKTLWLREAQLAGGAFDARGQSAWQANYSGAPILRFPAGEVALTGASGTEWKVQVPFKLPQTLQSTVPGGVLERTGYEYDADGNLLRQTEYSASGDVQSTYEYDALGRLVAQRRADREARQRYDLQGRLVAQLGGEGVKALAALAPGASAQQIDAVWTQWAERYVYDAAGRRTQAIDALGRTTLYYYDARGRITHTVNALGEVVEQRYNAFGDVEQAIAHAGRLTSLSLGQMYGGAMTDSARAALASVDSSLSRRAYREYDATGALAATDDAVNGRVEYTRLDPLRTRIVSWSGAVGSDIGRIVREETYTAAGALAQVDRYSNGVVVANEQITRDAWGNEMYRRVNDPGRSTIGLPANWFDRAGRLIAVVSVLDDTIQQQFAYDAFGNVISREQVTATGVLSATTYRYTAFQREVEMTTPEGVVTRTRYNEHGQVVEVTDGAGQKTAYAYDRDGRLVSTTRPDGTVSTRYDRAGQVVETIDARGVRTSYAYDAVGRVLTRTVDPDGLKLVTRYDYDAFGEAISTTDPLGAVTLTRYDKGGRQLEVVVDAGAGKLNLTTRFVYDQQGRVLETTEAAGAAQARTTRHSYDALGRMVASVRDPDGLALTTRFDYNARGDLIRRIDSNGGVTHFLYGDSGQLVYTIDPAGSVERQDWDEPSALLLGRSRFDVNLNLGEFDAFPQQWQITAHLEGLSAAVATMRYVYDRDGRLRYTVGALNTVVEQRYDAAGRASGTVTHATALGAGVEMTVQAIQAVLAAAAPAGNRVERIVYDAAGRIAFQIDAMGAVARSVYDAAGNLVRSLRYAVAYTGAGELSALTAWADAQPAAARIEQRWVYDNAGRPVFAIDAAGQVVEMVYDAVGNALRSIAYATAVDASARSYAQVRAALAAQSADAHAADRTVHRVYDAAGRLAYAIDALNYVVGYSYDGLGQVVRSTAYAAPLGAATDKTVAAVAAALAAQAHAEDRIGRTVFDAVGRVEFQLDAAGYLTQNRYDADGNLVARIRYENAYPAAAAFDRAALTAWAAGQPATAKAEERWFYDGAQRLRWQIDAGGYVTGHEYDGFGNRVRTAQYKLRYDGPPASGSNIGAWASAMGGNSVAVTLRFFDLSGREVYTFDAMGYFAEHGYDAFGAQIRTVRYDGRWPAQFGAAPVAQGESLASLRARLAGAAGSVAQQRYDANGRLVERVDALGGVTRYEYDGFGQVVAETVAYGSAEQVATRRKYDSNGRVVELTRAAGTAQQTVETYRYDGFGQRVASVDPRAREISESDSVWAQEQRLRLGFSKGAGSSLVALGAGELSAAQRQQLVDGYTTRNSYDANGRLLSTIDGTGAKVDRVYNAFGDAVAVTDAMGRTGYFYFDALGRVVQQIDPEQYLTATDYDADGHAVAVRRYANRVTAQSGWGTAQAIPAGPVAETRMSYDLLGRLVATTDAEGGSESYEYDAFGQRTLMRNKLGGETVYGYDLLGRLTDETYRDITVALRSGGTGKLVNRYGYDARGNLVYQAEADGSFEQRVVRFGYDKLDRRISSSATVSDGNAEIQAGETFGYDARGNLSERIDARGKRTAYWYDAADRLRAQLDPNGLLTEHQYDGAGNRVATRAYELPATGPVAPAGSAARETHYLYDAANRRVEQRKFGAVVARLTRMDGGVEKYQGDNDPIVERWTYDLGGRLVKHTDGNGGITRSYYDALGRKRLEVDGEGYGVAWERDAEGNALSETRFALRYAGALPDPVQTRFELGGGSAVEAPEPEFPIGLPGDPNPPVLSSAMSATASGAGSNTSTTSLSPAWDLATLIAGWPRDVQNDRSVLYSYDKMGRRLSETRLYVDYGSVDAAGRLTRYEDGSAATAYAYDAAGNLLRRTDANGSVFGWEYDKAGRNTAQVLPGFTDYAGRLVAARTEFVYNGLNQVAKQTRRGVVAGEDRVDSFVYGAGGRLLSQTNASNYTFRFGYDANGNQVGMSYVRTDSAGAQRNETVQAAYDAAGLEIQRVTVAGDGSRSAERRTRYNLFGEVTGRGIGTGSDWHEFAEYDLAGRMVKSNMQGGITKAFVYDANGNAALQMESQATELRELGLDDILRRADVFKTVTVYDKRNQAIRVEQPKMDINGERLDLQVFYMPASRPGDANVTVGGPVGSIRQPNLTPATGGTPIVGASNVTTLPPVTGDHLYLGWPGGGNTHPPQAMPYQFNIPDYRAVFGAEYSIRVVIEGEQRNMEYVYVPNPDDPWDRPRQEWQERVVPLNAQFVGNQDSRSGFVQVPVALGATYLNQNADVAATMSFTVKVFVTPRGSGGGRELEIGSNQVNAAIEWKIGWRHDGRVDVINNTSLASSVTGTVPPQFGGKVIQMPIDAYSADTVPKLYVRPRYSGGAYQELWVNRDFSQGKATVDIAGLGNGQYDVIYVAVNDRGDLVRRESYVLQVGPSQFISAVDNVNAGAFQVTAAGTFITATDHVLMFNMRTRTGAIPSGATVRYRPLGGSEASWSAETPIGGYARASEVVWGTAGLSGAYEVQIRLYNGSGGVLDMLTGQLQAGGAPSFSLNYQATTEGSALRIDNLPRNADQISLSLKRPNGTTIEIGPEPISVAGSYLWTIPDWLFAEIGAGSMRFDVAATLIDNGTDPRSSYSMLGSVEIGPQRSTPYAILRPSQSVYSVTFAPQVAAGQAMVVRYRREGALDDEFRSVTLLRGGDGKFYWDSLGLDQNVYYEYVYDVYASLADARAGDTSRSLKHVNGRFQTSVQPPKEAHWVVWGMGESESVITRHQTYNAFGQIASETDGNKGTTTLEYNTLGALTVKREAMETFLLANGAEALRSPTTVYSYDRTGNLVGTIDANGNLNTQSWNYGAARPVLASEWHADGGLKRYDYDSFGNQRVVVDEIGRRSDYTYDAQDRLVRIDRPQVGGQRAWDVYGYDELDRRTSHSSLIGRETTDYSIEGEVSRYVSMEGRVTLHSSTWVEQTLPGATMRGYWVRTTTMPGGAKTMTDTVDAYGRMVKRVDFGGHVTEYTYNSAGLLKTQGRTSYEYYKNGLIKRSYDSERRSRAYYEYDANGNRTFEGFTSEDGAWAFQQSTARYDKLNRLVEITDPRYKVAYQYDAVGNRIHMVSTYLDGLGSTIRQQGYWYQYDSMNRFTVTMGVRVGQGESAQVQAGSGDGVTLSYDRAGQRIYARYGSDQHEERYVYDALGNLTDTYITLAGEQEKLRARRVNDLAGRVLNYVEYRANGSEQTNLTHTWDRDNLLMEDRDNLTGKGTKTYRLADGTVNYTETYGTGDNVRTSYTYEWFDSARQTHIRSEVIGKEQKWASGLSRFVYDSAGRIMIAFDQAGHRGFRYHTDGEGRILRRDELVGGIVDDNGVAQNATANRSHNYYFMDDRQIGDVGNERSDPVDYARQLAERSYKAGSDNDFRHKRFAPVDAANFDQNYIPINSDYPSSSPGSYIVREGDTLQGIALVLWGDAAMWYLLADANGLTAEEVLTANTVLTVPNKVTNIHNNTGTFKPYDAGAAMGDTSPTLPDPPPPPAPKKGCGGFVKVLAIVVAVVVTIYTAGVASAAMAPGAMSAGAWGFGTAMSAGLGASAGAMAVGAAVGSIASQGVLIAGGVQDKFSWKDVGLAAVGGAITAGIGDIGFVSRMGDGLGTALGSQGLGRAIVTGAAGNVANQAVNMLAGEQSGFDWKSVAISAVGAGVGYGVGQGIGRWQYGGEAGWSAAVKSGAASKEWQRSLVRGFAKGAAAGTISAAARGTLNSNVLMQVGLDALGSTIGNVIADSAAERASSAVPGIGPVVRQAIALERGSVSVDDIAMEYEGLAPRLSAGGKPVRQAAASMAGESNLANGLGLADHVNTPSEQVYVDEVVKLAMQSGLRPPNSRAYPLVKQYAESGYKDPVSIEALGVYGDPEGAATNRAIDRLLDNGNGWGVLNTEAIEAYVARTGESPRARAPYNRSWMGTGSAGAWRDMKTLQANENLGAVVAPAAYLGGVAKSIYELGEFTYDFGKALAGTMTYVSTFGAFGEEGFQTSARVASSFGRMAWNLGGGLAYLQTGGAFGGQEYAEARQYLSAIKEGLIKLDDSTAGAWSRGEYVQASATVGSIIGLPVPLDEAPALVKAASALDELVDAARAGREVKLAQSDLGALLGRGGNKDVFAFGDDLAVGVLREGKNPKVLLEEVELLKKLENLGLPTVNARGPVMVDANPALIFDLFAQGSKDVVRTINGVPKVVGESAFLNKRSAVDLAGIRKTMVDKDIFINDLQFLIGKDGRVVIADPLDVKVGVKPSKTNLKMIDRLIEQANKSGH